MSEAARRGTVEVRKATAADVPGMARALGRAFYDDPVMAWMMPEERRRRRLESLGFVQWLKRIYMPKGEVYTDGALGGAALWAPPGKWRMPIRLQARMGPMFIRLVGARRTPLILKGLAVLDKNHPDDQPHYYLGVLGTDPDHQGKGVGSALMQPILERCDTEGLGAYLESSKESNVPFYRRHGFEVTGQVHMPDGPPLWPMWRDPQPQSG